MSRPIASVIPTKTPPGVEQQPEDYGAQGIAAVIPTKTPPGVEQSKLIFDAPASLR